ncbi:MAG: N-acetylmuramate alpha-1-phosphate uridylyltransferase MurU [Betaproteobacteria bacterium]
MRAMVLAAGRGERMRPLTDSIPKPLLCVGGKPLIVWQIERLVKAGFDELVINVSYRGAQIVAALGNGAALGARITYSEEVEPLESAGGLAHALPHLGDAPVLVVAADVYAEYSYARLVASRAAIAAGGPSQAHLVLVPNPAFRPHGDYSLSAAGTVGVAGAPRWTWAGIGLFHPSLLREIPFGQKIPLLPFFADWIGRGVVSGELFDGVWDNLGTPEQLHELDARMRGDNAAG